MFYRNILILVIMSFIVLNLTGCFTLFDIVTEDTPNTLAEYLKMRKNYWYIMDKDGAPVLFYNDFQDYTLIIKAKNDNERHKNDNERHKNDNERHKDDNEKNKIYKRKSLNQSFGLEDKNIKLPPECKGICTHFLYEGKKACFFDLDAFCYRYGAFREFIINGGKEGVIYFNLLKSFDHYYWEFNILRGIEYYRILQAEPDFHLLDLSSGKNRYDQEKDK